MMTDRRAALQSVEDLLTTSSVPESRKFAHQSRLADADASVQELLDAAPDDELLLAACRLAEARGLRDEAMLRWERLRDISPEHRDVATFHLAVARSRNGELAAARQLLDGLDGSSSLEAPHLAKETRRLAERVDRATSQELVLRALTLLDDGKRRHGQDLLNAALVLSGVPSEHRGTARAIVRAVCSLLTDGEVTTSPPTPSSRIARLRAVAGRFGRRLRAPAAPQGDPSDRPVLPAAFVAGFGWSGSGAVFDYLVQFEQVVTPVGRTEIPWIERPFGAKGVLREIEEGGDTARRAAVRFVLASVLGVGDPAAGEPWRPETVRSLGQVGARSAVQVLSGAHHVRAVGEGSLRLLSAAAVHGSDEQVAAVVRDELFAVLQHLVATPQDAQPRAALAALNNPVHGFNARFVEHFPWATLLPVLRDPRDQYVSRLLESGGRKTGVERFISTVSKHYERYERAVAQRGLQDQVIPVQFEEFVTDATARRDLLERLGLDPSLDEQVTRYDPSTSVANIGIHRQYDDRQEIRAIEEQMGRYLVDAAD